MFDSETEKLIRAAPPLEGIESDRLPELLSEDFASLILSRLQPDSTGTTEARLSRLRRLASVYEGLVDFGLEEGARRSAAFVAGTAHRLLIDFESSEAVGLADQLLTKAFISHRVASPLLFLIAGQFPDSREIGRSLLGRWEGNLIRASLLESVSDLAREDFASILDRAERLNYLRPSDDTGIEEEATNALYGICWSGIVSLAAEIIGEAAPALIVGNFESARAAFDQVISSSVSEIDTGLSARYLSTYSGPRHLARLLRHLSRDLSAASLVNLPPPKNTDPIRWRKRLRTRLHAAKAAAAHGRLRGAR